TPERPIAVVAGADFFGLLVLDGSLQLFGCSKARVGTAAPQQVDGITKINLAAFALQIRSVLTAYASGSFVYLYIEIIKIVYYLINRTFDLTLLVRVFY